MKNNHSFAAAIHTPIQILHIEDSPGDRLLVQKVLHGSIYPFKIHHVHDGQKAIDYLYQQGNFTESIRPDLILMDLHMPRKTGFEVLLELKANHDLSKIPIIILSSSVHDHHILNPYDPYTHRFMLKPMDFDGFKSVGKSIEQFWERLKRS